jgi:hypothetical protein
MADTIFRANLYAAQEGADRTVTAEGQRTGCLFTCSGCSTRSGVTVRGYSRLQCGRVQEVMLGEPLRRAKGLPHVAQSRTATPGMRYE